MEPKLSDLLDERAGKLDEIANMQKEAGKRSDKKLNADEIKRFKELDAEIRGLDEQIEVAERAQKLLKGREEKRSDAGKQDDAEKRNAPHVSGVRDLEAEKGFDSFKDQMSAIRDAGYAMREGRSIDKRLLHINEEHRAATGANATVGAEGAFLIKPTFSKEIWNKTYETGSLVSRVPVLPLDPGSDRLVINGVDETSRVAGNHFGGVVAYWKGEAASFTASKPKFREIELKLKKLTGLYYETGELRRSGAASAELAKMAFANVFGFYLDAAVLNGTGATQPLGIRQSGGIISVAKETGQAAATFNITNALKMLARVPIYARKNLVWLMNQAVMPQLPLMTIGNMPVYSVSVVGGVTTETLLGIPIIWTEQCETLGTQGDILLVAPDCVVAIRRGDIQVDSSIHVQFLADEEVFRFITEYDSQPVYNASLTSAKGSVALSPYVQLDTRN